MPVIAAKSATEMTSPLVWDSLCHLLKIHPCLLTGQASRPTATDQPTSMRCHHTRACLQLDVVVWRRWSLLGMESSRQPHWPVNGDVSGVGMPVSCSDWCRAPLLPASGVDDLADFTRHLWKRTGSAAASHATTTSSTTLASS
jgi:hypothetical protein